PIEVGLARGRVEHEDHPVLVPFKLDPHGFKQLRIEGIGELSGDDADPPGLLGGERTTLLARHVAERPRGGDDTFDGLWRHAGQSPQGPRHGGLRYAGEPSDVVTGYHIDPSSGS